MVPSIAPRPALATAVGASTLGRMKRITLRAVRTLTLPILAIALLPGVGRGPADAADGREPGDARPGNARPEAMDFASNVTLHVVLHELAHALIREFDLPVLGNEETAADAFATWYLTTHLPERAAPVLEARVRSLMLEARETPRDDWSGEHNHDGRRAFQIAALAVAADAEAYAGVAAIAEMSDEDIRRARDYGTEIHRSWRRVLQPLWMPPGEVSGETRLVCDDGLMLGDLTDGLAAEVRDVLGRIDWHSQITVHFAEGDGGAGWSRSRRTITVHSGYLERFIRQGEAAARGR